MTLIKQINAEGIKGYGKKAKIKDESAEKMKE